MSASDSTTRSTPLRAIIWCAVSSEEQAKDDKTSLKTQERDARAFAAEQGFDVNDVIIVGGFSRRFFNYPDFVDAAEEDGFYDPVRMLEHWRRRDFDVLIALDGSRAGREQGIFGEFIGRTIESGARLYMLTEGWIDKSNYRMYIAMGGYSASTQVNRLRDGQRETKLKSAAKGLTTTSKHPYSHKWVRNEAGKLVRLELDESKRRLWDDLATVFLDGVGYNQLEKVLYEKYGHVDERTGKPFAHYFFYHLLYNPYFWGHSARNYNGATTKNGQKIGAWVYDQSCPAPEGVHIFYNVNTPVYTGDLAERIRAELQRRTTAIQGTARPYRTHKFSGLVLCGYCGRTMVFGDNHYRCELRWKAKQEPKCDRYRQISEAEVQIWVNARLSEMLEDNMPDLLARGEDAPDFAKRIAELTRDIADLQEQARNLVLKQAQAHSALTPIYDEQLQAIGERIDILQKTLAQTEREVRSRDTSTAVAAFRSLPENLAEIWEWDGTTINQLMHRLMGQRRLVARDNQIVGTQEAPVHPRRKERKRTYFGKGRHSPTE